MLPVYSFVAVRERINHGCRGEMENPVTASESLDGLPGLGDPRWQVELLRVRNGQLARKMGRR